MKIAKKTCSFMVMVALLLFVAPTGAQAGRCGTKSEICSTVFLWKCTAIARACLALCSPIGGLVSGTACGLVGMLTCVYISETCDDDAKLAPDSPSQK